MVQRMLMTKCGMAQQEDRQAKLNTLIELLDADIDIASIDTKLARSIRDDVKRQRIRPGAESFSFEVTRRDAAIRHRDHQRLDVTTYYNVYRSFFEWCTNEEYISRNPFGTLKLTVDKKPKKDGRIAFTTEQMRTIYGALDPQGKHYRYWGPLIGMYTGAQLNEVAQLELDDVQARMASGISC